MHRKHRTFWIAASLTLLAGLAVGACGDAKKPAGGGAGPAGGAPEKAPEGGAKPAGGAPAARTASKYSAVALDAVSTPAS